ncbi:nucleolar protein 14-like isoform X2 [Tubulanus polymorphus]
MTKKDQESENKTWKERMEEMIAKSKKEKYERQSEREKAVEMTNQLDEEWKDVRGLMSTGKVFGMGNEPYKPTTDDYDIAVREMAFELKGMATDRLKTEEELAKDEKERLEKLEHDRMLRMKGIVDEDGKSVHAQSSKQHRSAEDLDDGLLLDEDDRYHVRYNDGKLISDANEVEAAADDDDTKDDDDDSGSAEDEDDDENEEDDDDDAHDSDDSYSDIEMDEDEDEHEAEDVSTEMENEKSNEIVKELKKRKKVMDKARKELPYTFTAPEMYEDFLALLEEHSPEDQLTIVERLRKCHHPSLAEGNKEKLQMIFKHILQYYGDLATENTPPLQLIDKLTTHLYELCQQSPLESAIAMREVIQEREEGFVEYCERRKGRGIYPGLDTMLYFKLISVLFPTSDRVHLVVSPTVLFMTHLLSQCSVNHLRDVASGLFISNLLLQYVTLSKRYIPEVINFLRGILFLASTKSKTEIEAVVPPFKPVGPTVHLLEVSKEASKCEIGKLKLTILCCTDLRKLDNAEQRLSYINCCLHLVLEFAKLYSQVPAYKEVFAPVLHFVKKLPIGSYPKALQDRHSEVMACLTRHDTREREPVQKEKKKPPMIRQIEPKFDEIFDGRKKRVGSRESKEKQTLVHKYKKEMKGAIRELRRDNQFLAREKLQQQMTLDAERKRKVKEIYGLLGTQEGDVRALKRGKKKKIT